MATDSKTGAKYIDKDPPMESGGNLSWRILDYLAYLKETLNFIFSNYGRRLVNADGDINELIRTAEETTSRLSDAEGNISTLSQTADGLTTRVTNAEGNISTLSQTADGLTTRVESAEGNISTLQQTADGLTYEVYNANSTLNTSISAVAGKVAIIVDGNDNIKAAEIVAAVNSAGSSVVISADHVNLSGYVTFTNLSTSGQTNINGGNITTGSIDASRVTVENIDASKITTGQMSASRVNLTNYSTTSQMNAAISASETGILTTVSNTYETQANAAVVNLLPSVYYREYVYGTTYTASDITWTVNPDGSITATGTATANSDYYLTRTNDLDVPRIILDPTRKYTFSGVPLVTGCQFRVGFYTQTGTSASTTRAIESVASYTQDAGYYYATPYLRIVSGTALPSGGVTFRPMFEVGEEAHAYVSTHGGAYAMESQIAQNAHDITLKVSETDVTGNYVIGKINLNSTTATIEAEHIDLQGAVSITSLDSSLQSSVNGIPIVNLLPSVYRREAVSGSPWTSNGITWTVNNDGSVTASGTASGESLFNLTLNTATASVPWITLDPTKKYTMSGVPGVSGCHYRVQGLDQSGTAVATYQADTADGNGLTRTIPAGYYYAYAALRVTNGTAIPDGVTFYPMLEVGDVAHVFMSPRSGSSALFERTVTNATNINTNAQAISLEAQTRAADVSGVQSNLEAEIEIRSAEIQSLVENVETLDGSITQKVATAVTQSTSGLDARITSVKQTADDTAEVIDTHFEFSTAGMKIKGTEGSSDTSFLQLAADRVSLYENDTERLWLDEDGANAQAFNATQAVRVGSFIWEEYPGGFRLIKN